MASSSWEVPQRSEERYEVMERRKQLSWSWT